MKNFIAPALLVVLAACSSSQVSQNGIPFRKPPEPLTIKSYTSGETGFFASSHLILAKNDALLIDAQFTRKDARKLVTMIRETDRKLKYVFITHAHPDHYFGLEIIKDQFPGVKILATTAVVKDIIATASTKKEYWKKIYKDDLADDIIYPEPFNDSSFLFGNNEIQILNVNDGESKHASAIYIPALKTLATGDLTYNGVHLWLADTDGSPSGWIASLKKFKQRDDIDTILPGHGKAAGPVLLEANQKYIQKFNSALEEANTPEMAIGDLRAAFPDYQMGVILDLSVRARFKKEIKPKALENTPMTYK